MAGWTLVTSPHQLWDAVYWAPPMLLESLLPCCLSSCLLVMFAWHAWALGLITSRHPFNIQCMLLWLIQWLRWWQNSVRCAVYMWWHSRMWLYYFPSCQPFSFLICMLSLLDTTWRCIRPFMHAVLGACNKQCHTYIHGHLMIPIGATNPSN